MNFRKALLTIVTLLTLCSGASLVLAQSDPFHRADGFQRVPRSNGLKHSDMQTCNPENQKSFSRPGHFAKFENPENLLIKSPPTFTNLNKSETGGWASLGPEGGFISVLCMHPTDHNILYAQTGGNPAKIFKSTNGGSSWNLISRLPVEFYNYMVDPNNPSIMYGAYGNRIYKSIDEGANWTDYQIDTKWLYEPCIQINPNNSQIIYIGAYAYSNNKWSIIVYKSTNGGMNWSSSVVLPALYKNAYCYCLTLNRSNPEELYVGGVYYDDLNNYYSALFKSINGGVSWIDKSKGLERPIYDIKIDPTNSDKIYACNYNSIYHSIDGGATWQQNSGWAYGYKLAIDPQNTNIIYAGYYGSIYKSINSGVNWSYHANGLKGECLSLLVDHSSSNSLYYGSSIGCFKSSNSGKDWAAMNSGLVASSITTMALARSDPKKIFIEFYYNAVFKTSNSGDSWNQLPEFTSCGYIGALAVDNSSPDIAYALEESG
ncbi:MAG: hypothetical protein MUC94_04080 [bacterium]|nr:hypothetical protein [bacterium]